MIRADEDALICDFAETYHIYDYRGLGPLYAATLAVGLRNDSRIRTKMLRFQDKDTTDTMLLSLIYDKLSYLFWGICQGGKDENRPADLMSDRLFGKKKESEEKFGFATIEDFEAERRRLMGS